MPIIFDSLYLTGLTLGAPYIAAKMFLSQRFRAGLSQRLGYSPVRQSTGPCFWVHAASVGEVLMVRTFVKALEEAFPHWDIVVSTSTNTGFSLAKKNFEDKLVVYFPLDLSWIDRKVIERLRPSCIILVELEIWPNFIVACYERGIPIVLVNGRISERSEMLFQILKLFSGDFSRGLTSRKNLYCVRTEADLKRMCRLGIPEERLRVTGTMKYDAIPTDEDGGARQHFSELFGIESNDRVLVAGSTHPGEEEIILRVFKTLRESFKNLRLIIAPRHIERTAEVEAIILKSGLKCAKKTVLDGSNGIKNSTKETIILVDTLGDLARIYSLASCVFVGKSLVPMGGQNPLEPAAFGRPTVFGPHMFNFKEEVALLLEGNAAKVVSGEQELLGALRGLLTNPLEAEAMGERARQLIVENRGATGRNLSILKEFLKEERVS